LDTLKLQLLGENNLMKRLKALQGFTLVELMAVIAIIGILAAVVYPSYTKYVTKTNRLGAKMALAELAQLQEEYFIANKVYATSLGEGTDEEPGLKIEYYGFEKHRGTFHSKDNGDKKGYYKITMTNVNGFTITATADSDGIQDDDIDCAEFRINAIGNRTATSDCW